MYGKICVSKKFVLLVCIALFVAAGIILASNYIIKKPTTVKTRAEEVKGENLIINGEPALENEFPYFVLLSITKSINNISYVYQCGGALISEEYILTAAHCVDGVNEKDIFVIIGLNHIDSKLNAQFSSGIDAKIIRNDYVSLIDELDKHVSNDIALLHLKNKAVGVPTISIPNPSIDRNTDKILDKNDYPESVFAGNKVTIMGFGGFDEDRPRRGSNNLLKGSLYINEYEGRPVDKIKLLAQDGVNVCSGDSGGPLVMTINDIPQVIGVAYSADFSCVKWSIYTSVTNFSEWINKITGVNYGAINQNISPPPQSSQSSFCTDREVEECNKKGFFCKWYHCNQCAPRGTSEKKMCG